MDKNTLSKLIGSKKFTIVVTLLGLYFLAAGASWTLFSFLKKDPDLSGKDSGKVTSKIDPALPKTEECPINGRMFSKPEREIWEGRRPITAIIENHLDSRPSSGLSKADVVYEAVAEGGITRFLGIFYCGASADDVKIAPIRSVRVYYIDWAAEYGKKPIFVHIGGANNICNNCPYGVKPSGQVSKEADAFKVLSNLGWRYPKGNDFDGGTNTGYPIIVRDQYRLESKSVWEHSVVGFTDKIFDEAKKRDFGYKDEDGEAWIDDFYKWRFIDDKPAKGEVVGNISFEFWSGKDEYNVSWKYDSGKNSYLRVNGGKDFTDLETKEQISAKNVVIQFVKEKGPVDKEGHMIYTTVGEGKALIFQNGEVIEATWEKKSQSSRTKYFYKEGKEVAFVRGLIWIEAIPGLNKINY